MATGTGRGRRSWLSVMLVGAGGGLGCLGAGPTLPEPPGKMETTDGATISSPTDGGGTSATATNEGGMTSDTSATGTDEASSTASDAVCGNGIVEDGEQCDGMAGQTETCESLGYTAGVLACTECGFDASECGAPPGMVRVPGGVFEMGSESDPSFAPIRQVNVDTFFIDIDEVTAADYLECVNDAGCTPSPDILINRYYCNYMKNGKELHPINCVNWYEAVDYCEWVGGRLPTEAEWEKAARGQDARILPWIGTPGTLDCDHAWMDDGGYGYGCTTDSTGAVGTKSPAGNTPNGIHDMAGNVSEWVRDWYAPYDPEQTNNPTGPGDGDSHIVRGGGFSDGLPTYFYTYARLPRGDMNRFYYVGFRCVWDPTETP